jgi:dolichol-phosphate mannosyltransferase
MIRFIVPAYNEERNLPALLESLAVWVRARQEQAEIVVVDDGSRDRTPQIARDFDKLPLRLVQHPTNYNVHRVFDTGFRAVLESDPPASDLIVTLEADSTSSLDILETMLARARDGSDLVLASCYAPGGGVTGTNLYRKLMSACANSLLRRMPGMPSVRTYSSFYRVYSASLLRRLYEGYGDRLFEEAGFVCVVELLLKCAWLNAKIVEVPMVLRGEMRQGASKMKTLRTIRGYFRLFRKATLGGLARPSRASAGNAAVSVAVGKRPGG